MDRGVGVWEKKLCPHSPIPVFFAREEMRSGGALRFFARAGW